MIPQHCQSIHIVSCVWSKLCQWPPFVPCYIGQNQKQ